MIVKEKALSPPGVRPRTHRYKPCEVLEIKLGAVLYSIFAVPSLANARKRVPPHLAPTEDCLHFIAAFWKRPPLRQRAFNDAPNCLYMRTVLLWVTSRCGV
jgi:hypothetical protein